MDAIVNRLTCDEATNQSVDLCQESTLPVATVVSGATEPSLSLEDAMLPVMSGVRRRNVALERRKNARYPYPKLVRIVPLDDNDQPCGEPTVVVAKLVSVEGMGFFHPAPLVDRRVMVLLDGDDNEVVSLVMDVSWCRFKRHGWYESGGRFLRAVRPLVDE